MAIRTAQIGALAAVGLLLMACGQNGASSDATRAEWGPLSVLRGAPTGAEALIEGTVEVSARCVTLTGGGGPVLLVWPDDGTTWNTTADTIRYDDGDQVVELSDGDAFAVGGGGGSVAESGMNVTEWVGNDWVAEPDGSCPSDDWFFVGGLPPGVGETE
jgi:hypothetical protein